MSVSNETGQTDVLDISGNGKGVALNTGDAFGGVSSQFDPIIPQNFYQPTDSSFGQAIQRAIDHSYSLMVPSGYGQGSGPSVFIPAGDYTSNITLETHHNIDIYGEGVGGPSGPASKITFLNAITGFIGQGYGTSGNAAYGGPTVGGRLGLRRLALFGTFNGTVESNNYGVNLRGGGVLEDLIIRSFPGEGVYSFTDAASIAGNANGSYIKNVLVELCRHGFMMDGQDSNAWQVIGASAILNRGCGFLDSSALGNFYFGCHAATNGDGSYNAPSRCSYNNFRYCVLRFQEDWCKTNPPTGAATSNQGWYYIGPGGSDASWVPWVNGANFRCGAAYCADNVNNGAQFIACYSEIDALPHQMSGNALVLGAFTNTIDLGGNPWGGVMYAGGGGMNFLRAITAKGLFSNDQTNRISAGDPSLYLNATNAYASLAFEQAGALTATIFGFGGYLFHDTVGANGHVFRVSNGTQVATMDATGIKMIGAGRALYNNGNQVVGARGAAVTAPTGGATVDTQARTAINDLIARLQAHGLIS